MGTSEKAFRIVSIAAVAAVAAYLGYRAYKKRYPFDDSITKTAPIKPSSDNEFNHTGNVIFDLCKFNLRRWLYRSCN